MSFRNSSRTTNRRFRSHKKMRKTRKKYRHGGLYGPKPKKLTNTRPTTARPTNSRPTTARPTNSRPTNTRPTTARPTNSRPTNTRPTTSRPTTAKKTPSFLEQKQTQLKLLQDRAERLERQNPQPDFVNVQTKHFDSNPHLFFFYIIDEGVKQPDNIKRNFRIVIDNIFRFEEKINEIKNEPGFSREKYADRCNYQLHYLNNKIDISPEIQKMIDENLQQSNLNSINKDRFLAYFKLNMMRKYENKITDFDVEKHHFIITKDLLHESIGIVNEFIKIELNEFNQNNDKPINDESPPVIEPIEEAQYEPDFEEYAYDDNLKTVE